MLFEVQFCIKGRSEKRKRGLAGSHLAHLGPGPEARVDGDHFAQEFEESGPGPPLCRDIFPSGHVEGDVVRLLRREGMTQLGVDDFDRHFSFFSFLL
jgi:hypothetical protein